MSPRPLPRQEAQSYGGDPQRDNYSSERERGRRRRQDDIPKLPKTFFIIGQQSSEGSRPFTPTTADPFNKSIAESTESPIHWGSGDGRKLFTPSLSPPNSAASPAKT
ncbi:unnamed protein product [Linum trigynum]|uniref:Uncharacterized protein n=1 Tax=Linum trigynum TaxID=586398 RepID=A0AAV2EPR1_9ROSI